MDSPRLNYIKREQQTILAPKFHETFGGFEIEADSLKVKFSTSSKEMKL